MRKIREEKMSLVSKVGFGDGLSPLEILSETVCSIFKMHQVKQEHSLESPKKRSSLYFNFLNDTSSPSNTTPVSINFSHHIFSNFSFFSLVFFSKLCNYFLTFNLIYSICLRKKETGQR